MVTTTVCGSSPASQGVCVTAGRLIASPDVAVGGVAALTETSSLVVASASGSQRPRIRMVAAESVASQLS